MISMPSLVEAIARPAEERQSASIGTAAPSSRNIKALTGLRFFLIFAIVSNHGKLVFPSWSELYSPLNLTQTVSFFFVLSGFLLTYSAPRFSGTKSVLRFYLSRITRIWPVHVFGLLLLVFLVPELFKVRNQHLPVFLSNLFLVHAWIPTSKFFFSYNSPSWSLSTLVFFYLCFPLLWRGVQSRWYLVLGGSAAMVAGLFCLCNAACLPEFDPNQLCVKGVIYVYPLCRVFEFVIGMLFAVAYQRYAHKIKLTGLTATLLELFSLGIALFLSVQSTAWRAASLPWASNAGSLWLQNSGLTVVPFALITAVLATEKGFIARILRVPLLIRLGQASFGIFILHAVLMAYRTVRFPHDVSFGASLLYVATLLVAADLLWVVFEQPVRKALLALADGLLAHDSERVQTQAYKASQPWYHISSNNVLIATGEALLLIILIALSSPVDHKTSHYDATADTNVVAGRMLQLSGRSIQSLCWHVRHA